MYHSAKLYKVKEGNMRQLSKAGVALLATFIGMLVLAGCPQESPPPPPPTVTSVTVNPGTTVARRGDVLDFTATVSGANNHPTTVTWGVDGVPGTQIAGDGRLTVANNETAATLTVRATSTLDATISGTATVTVIPGLGGSVTISGVPRVGETLTAITTALGGSGDISFDWQRGTVSISGATGPTYVLREIDVGHTIRVVVSRAGYDGSVTSLETDTIMEVPDLEGVVTISGTPQMWQTLTADISGLATTGTTSFSYQWQRGTTDIPGATNPTFMVRHEDIGQTLRVAVTRAGYEGTVISTPTVTVSAATVVITGAAQVGQELTVDISALGGAGAPSFQWQQGTTPIQGATGTSFTVREADMGHTLRVVVTRSGYTGSAESVPTATVTAAVPPGPTGWIADIDWSSHPSATMGFIVDNMSSYRLVAFEGSVHPNHLLGGIPPLAENHGIFRNPSVFNRTRAITVVLVNEEDLIEHDAAGTLPSLSASPFTSIMVLYNHGMANNHRHRISNRPGGRHRLIVANPTDHNVEFRINSPLAGGDGVLGFSPMLSHSTVFHLTDHVPPNVETLIFPVFRFFHPVSRVVSEIFPVWPQGAVLEGQPWFINLATAVNLPAVNQTINVQDLLNQFSMSLDAVWIEIENITDTPLTFFQGTSAIPDSMGTLQIPNVMPDNRRTMVFSTRPGTGPALPNLNVGNLWIGPSAAMRTTQIVGPEGETNFQLRSDHRYRVVVSGSMLDGFTAVLYVDEGEPVNIQELIQQDRD